MNDDFDGVVYSARVAGPMVLPDGSIDPDRRADMSYYFAVPGATTPPEWLAEIIAEHAERVGVAS